jgi:hypothetical protein
MFINSHLGLLSLDNLASFGVLAAGLNQALGTAGGIIQANRPGRGLWGNNRRSG